MKRFDILVSHKDKTGKWRSSKVGAAFEKDDGSWSLVIDPGVSIASGADHIVSLRAPLPPRDSQQTPAPKRDDDTPF